MSAAVFADELGPRARRRVRIVSGVAFVAVAALVALALRRFAAAGQLEAELWTVLVLPEVLRFLA
ncbi:MAG: amino acid ABC transporter permease, partial [Actinomycetota bacterium]|nr:amino acid ABC transporter permease [Actinomycetota bacterium]